MTTFLITYGPAAAVFLLFAVCLFLHDRPPSHHHKIHDRDSRV
jgi:hypothetical protein